MDDLAQGSFRRAALDTWDQIHSPLFWVAEVSVTVVGSVFAVSLYPNASTVFEDAQTQAWIVVGALLVLLFGVFLANFIALSPRRQRTEARVLALQLYRKGMSDDESAALIQELIDLQIRAGSFVVALFNPDTAEIEVEGFGEWLVDVRRTLARAGRRYESSINVVSTRLAAKEFDAAHALSEASETIRSAVQGLEEDLNDPRMATQRSTPDTSVGHP